MKEHTFERHTMSHVCDTDESQILITSREGESERERSRTSSHSFHLKKTVESIWVIDMIFKKKIQTNRLNENLRKYQ